MNDACDGLPGGEEAVEARGQRLVDIPFWFSGVGEIVLPQE